MQSAVGKKGLRYISWTQTRLHYEYAPAILPEDSKHRHHQQQSKAQPGHLLLTMSDVGNVRTALKRSADRYWPFLLSASLLQEQFEAAQGRRSGIAVRARNGPNMLFTRTSARSHAVKALKARRYCHRSEKLMNQSHVSLRDDYEVSCKEIDLLVDLSWNTPGVIGSRITGGGFGGCTVSIVKNEAVDNFIKNVGEAYKEKFGYEAEFYVVDIGVGASRLDV